MAGSFEPMTQVAGGQRDNGSTTAITSGHLAVAHSFLKAPVVAYH